MEKQIGRKRKIHIIIEGALSVIHDKGGINLMNENGVTLDLKSLPDWEEMILWDNKSIAKAIADKFPNLPDFTIDEFVLSLAETDLNLCTCKALANRECVFTSHGRKFWRDDLKSNTFVEINLIKGEWADRALKQVFDTMWGKNVDN